MADSSSAHRVYKPQYDIFYRHNESLRKVEEALRLWLAASDGQSPQTARDYVSMDQLTWPTTTALDMPSYKGEQLQAQYRAEWKHTAEEQAGADVAIRALFETLSGIEPGLQRGALRSVEELRTALKVQAANDLIYPSMPIAVYGWLSQQTIPDKRSVTHLRGDRRQKVVLCADGFPSLAWPSNLLRHVVFVMGLVGPTLNPLTITVAAAFF